MKAVTITSPPHVLMADLQHAMQKGDIGLRSRPGNYRTLVKHQTAFSDTHVYDFGHQFDADDPGTLGSQAYQILRDESLALWQHGKLFLPHPNTLLLHRITGLPGHGIFNSVIAYWLAERPLGAIDLTVFYIDNLANTNRRIWGNAGAMELARLGDDPNTAITLHGFHQDTIEARTTETQGHLDLTLAALALLNRKGDAVVREPSTWTWSDLPYSYRGKIHPSPVSVVKVNTERVLRAAPEDATPSGATVRGHDRRQHLRRVGRKLIVVKACPVNGGASAPTAKVIQLARAL